MLVFKIQRGPSGGKKMLAFSSFSAAAYWVHDNADGPVGVLIYSDRQREVFFPDL
jgi:hypothetical protein